MQLRRASQRPRRPGGRRTLRRAAGLLAASTAVACCSSACVPEPEPGEFGTFRYVGNVKGATPLNVLPPLSDRDGNAYVLYGDLGLLGEAKLFIGRASGGWYGCDITSTISVVPGGAIYGLHGFVGRAQNRAWAWAGEMLVRGSGRTGACTEVLDNDPSSGANLGFRAVIPWVLDTPSRTTALAWIQSATDPVPFQVVLDLDQDVYTNISEFSPRDATEIQVLGVGGNVSEREGLIIVRYRRGDQYAIQARFIDHQGETVDKNGVSGMETIPEFGIVGYLQSTSTGLYGGLAFDGAGAPFLVLLDRSGGGARPFGDYVTVAADTAVVGVQVWEDQLWAVGTEGGRPKVWEITDDGDVKAAKTWKASLAAAGNLGTIEVLDDRSLPSRKTKWSGARTATGAFPFLHAHRLDHYADGTTVWLVAGPDFQVSGGETWTAIAHAPVGISYP